MTEDRKERCETCKWWQDYPEWNEVDQDYFWRNIIGPDHWGCCKLFPQSIKKLADDFCGQWKACEDRDED